jgi:hypothetical protein
VNQIWVTKKAFFLQKHDSTPVDKIIEQKHFYDTSDSYNDGTSTREGTLRYVIHTYTYLKYRRVWYSTK